MGNNPINANDPSGKVIGKIAKNSGTVIAAKLTTKQIERRRKRAVNDAWRLEQRLYLETGATTIEGASLAELNELATRRKIKGYEGHHMWDVNTYPERAGDTGNIKFVAGRSEHLKEHNNFFGNSTKGTEGYIDRSAGGTLDPIIIRGGRELIGSATTEFLGILATTIGGIATAAEYLDYVDPLTYIFHSGNLGGGHDVVPQSWSSPASGGYVLYPSRANTNIMQQIYTK